MGVRRPSIRHIQGGDIQLENERVRIQFGRNVCREKRHLKSFGGDSLCDMTQGQGKDPKKPKGSREPGKETVSGMKAGSGNVG